VPSAGASALVEEEGGALASLVAVSSTWAKVTVALAEPELSR
jgi:hypothetical protein